MGSLQTETNNQNTQFFFLEQNMSRGKNVCNYVHQDEIWKDHVRTEHTAGKKWPNKWGYTTVIYNSLEDSLTGRSDEHTSCFAKELNRQYGLIHDAQRIESDPIKSQRFTSKSNRRLTLKPISQALPPSLTVDDKALRKVSSRNDVLSRPNFIILGQLLMKLDGNVRINHTRLLRLMERLIIVREGNIRFIKNWVGRLSLICRLRILVFSLFQYFLKKIIVKN